MARPSHLKCLILLGYPDIGLRNPWQNHRAPGVMHALTKNVKLQVGLFLQVKKDNTMKKPDFTIDLCIVSLSSSPWEHPFWVSRQFLMYELAKHCPVVYATGRIQIRNMFTLDNLKTTYFPKAPPFLPPDNLTIQKPPLTIPKIFKYKKADRIMANAYGRLLRKKCRKVSYGKIVAYVWEPRHMDLLEGLQPDLAVYHPYDKFETMAWTDEEKTRVRKLEKDMAKAADIVITPHKKIAESLYHRNTHVIHNGVFTPALMEHTRRNNTVFRDIPRPRIGYIGTISAKLDFPLLLETAQKKPDVSIILMGPQILNSKSLQERIKPLHQAPNIYFFPAVRFDRVFEYMMQLDMGIIPYSLSGHAGYSESPLKMYQYWLCGLPVITTGLPNIVEESGIMYCGNTPLEWTEKITDALEKNSSLLRQKRKEKALENSWEKRAAQVFDLIKSA